MPLCEVWVSCFGSVGFCFVSRVSGFKARGFRAPGGLPPRLRRTSAWSLWTYAGPCCYYRGPCCFLLYARDGWGCAAAHTDSGCRPSGLGLLQRDVTRGRCGLGTDVRDWTRFWVPWRALGRISGGALHTEFTTAGGPAGWVDLATTFFKADVYRYGAGRRVLLGLFWGWAFRLVQGDCGCMPLRFCAALNYGSSWAFWCEDVHSNWAAARVDLVACSRTIARCKMGLLGCWSERAGSLAALARVFFNDGVPNEGVSHVI